LGKRKTDFQEGCDRDPGEEALLTWDFPKDGLSGEWKEEVGILPTAEGTRGGKGQGKVG